MSKINVMIKPDNISWEELAYCQQKAHEVNHSNSVIMNCSTFTGKQLQEAVKNGITLVATNDTGDLMGTLSICWNEVNRLWYRGLAAYICFVAVLPEYKGKGVYRELANYATNEIKKRGINVEYLNTHEKNYTARRIYENNGYRCVRFSPGSGTDYYSIEMAKFLNGRKKKVSMQIMFLLSEFYVRLFYKQGKIRRF